MKSPIEGELVNCYFDFKGLNVEKLKQYKEEIFNSVKGCYDQVVAVKEERNFANTLQPIIEMEAKLQQKINAFCYVENFYTQEEWRKFASDASAEISKFMIDQSQRKDVYNAFLNYEQSHYKNKEKSELTFEEVRFVEKKLRDFRREGLHLEDKEFIEMKKELSDICIKYSSNVNEENTKFEFTRKQLDGLPESWFNEKRLLKKSDNKDDEVYQFTLKYPDYYPGMQYIKDSELRNKIQFAYNSRCAESNSKLAERATVLRYLIAKKLGYESHADFSTEVKIVKNGKTALDFENGLNDKFQPLYEQDIQNLTEFAKEYKENPLGKDKLDPWDFSFYMRAYKEVKCDLNMEEIKKYFPLEKVTEGLFEIYQTLLGLKFNEVETDNKWHEDVKLYSVSDKKTGDLIGYFYFDLFPRDGKYSHAACFDFLTGCDTSKFQDEELRNMGRLNTVCCVACNFEKDGCISFSDVETFFHEFGHVMHYLCCKVQLQEFGAFGVETDFVEAPSQMLEYWCYETQPLQMMSKHEQTGEPIPEEIVKKLKQMENTLQGYHNKRQLMFGLYDLKIHCMTFENEDQKLDSQKVWYENEKAVMGFDNSNKANPAASFGHLYGGYDAGYYGYLRAECYAANMFYKMFKDGKVLCEETGMRYRTKLLQPGSTKDGVQLVEDFLGEPTNDTYFLIAKGLQQ